MKNIGIIGRGFVGNAVFEVFKHYFNMSAYDINPHRSTVKSLTDLFNCKVVFIALPTPMNKDGSINLDIYHSTLSKLDEHSYYVREDHRHTPIFVLKSSLPPGTTIAFEKKYRNLSLIFNPEFLTEKNAVEDFRNQTKVILGGDVDYAAIVREVYQIALPGAIVHQTDSITAETVKFIVNCFLATKVSFFNEMNQLCSKLDVNYNDAIRLALLDSRIGSSHTIVPGPDGHAGFGGSCFPANVNIMINEMIKADIKPTVLKAVWDKNLEVRPEKDWELLKGRAVVDK